MSRTEENADLGDGCVVVTGASAGVGRACAKAFARRGYRVGLIARGEAGLNGALRDVEAAGGRGLVLPADVADAAAIEDAAARANAELGPIRAWCNVAMATVFSPLAEMDAEEFRRATEVTYLGQVYGTMSALRRMRKAGRGIVVNVGSALGYQGLPLQSAYCAAKFALRGFNEAVRSELDHFGPADVHLSTVILPAVNTPQFDWARNRLPQRPQPVPPIFQPEVPAEAIVRAAHTGEREIVVGASNLKILLGAAFAPGIVERILAGQGISGQQTSKPARKRPDNLFTPLDAERDYGVHGRFGSEARSTGMQITGSALRAGLVGTGVAAAAISGLLGFALGRRRRDQ